MIYYSCSLPLRHVRQQAPGPPLRCQAPLLFVSGAKGTRTLDLLHAMQALFQLSYSPIVFTLNDEGGAEGIRTPDLYSAIVALFQLSYSPVITRERVYSL